VPTLQEEEEVILQQHSLFNAQHTIKSEKEPVILDTLYLMNLCLMNHAYAVLEAISQAYAIMENSTPSKYKTVKDIEKSRNISLR